MVPGKFSLTWNEFEQNIRVSFKALREEQKLFDVVLATDDGHQIQAHKVILSSGSDFFSNIFSKCNQPNMLIYLKGIAILELENITNFLYDGEAFVSQHDLTAFLETAQELKLKGLQSVEENIARDLKTEVPLHIQELKEKLNVSSNEIETHSVDEENHSNTQYDDGTHVNPIIDDDQDFKSKNRELDKRLDELVEKCVGLWKCKICDKTGKQKVNIKTHAEIHVQGMSYSCNVCRKSFSTRSGLRTHINDIHSKLYACISCGKLDMNKVAVRRHKNACEGIIEEQLAKN